MAYGMEKRIEPARFEDVGIVAYLLCPDCGRRMTFGGALYAPNEHRKHYHVLFDWTCCNLLGWTLDAEERTISTYVRNPEADQ